jgi:hydrogenase expression/formation protein HypE
MAEAARKAKVSIVAGDTKVVPRGHGGGIYFSVSGIGEVDPGLDLSMKKIRPGDRIIVSGTVGDHGAAVMLAREDFGLHGDVISDCGSVLPLTSMLSGIDGVHFLRDPTRGGLATVAHEMARVTGFRVRLRQEDIPVNESVGAVCEILGYDPYYLACEGRCVAVVAADIADEVVKLWQGVDVGEGAAIIGVIEPGVSEVLLETPIGGERRLEELEDDPLPRIC